MRDALLAEYRKLVTTRLWWVLLVTMLAYMVFMTALIAFAVTVDPSQGGLGQLDMSDPSQSTAALDPLSMALAVYTLALSFGYVFPVIVGALSVAGEFRHQTITPTLLAEPRRWLVLGSKLLASVPIGFLFGLAGVASALVGGASVLALRGEATMLDESEVLRVLAMSVVAMGAWSLVGVGFGALLKNQVAAIVVVLAFTQLVEPTLRFAFGFVDQLHGAAKWLPGAAGEAIAGSSFYSATGVNELLSRWQGLLVLLGYGLVFAAIGRLTTLRRDIS